MYYFELGEQKEVQCCLLKYTIISELFVSEGSIHLVVIGVLYIFIFEMYSF